MRLATPACSSGVLAVVLASLVNAACGGAALFQQYEYEEEMQLALDGSATLLVHSSVPALNLLRGASFDPRLEASLSRGAVRAFFETPDTEVTRVTFSSRHGRRYVHVRMRVADVRRLGSTAQFGWSSYTFAREGERYIYRQRVGRPAAPAAGGYPWVGDEVVAFRLHVPSKVVFHNVDRVRRGNILAWEQPLADRLAGTPLEMEVRMETQSILYRALGLFGATILAVAALFGLVLWWVAAKGRRPQATGPDVGVRPGAHA